METTMTEDEARTRLATILQLRPDLVYGGLAPAAVHADWRRFSPEDYQTRWQAARDELAGNVHTFRLVYDWLGRVERRRAINTSTGSYGLKHVVERIIETYVANGVMIAAALARGFPARQCQPGSPNMYFGMKTLDLQAAGLVAHLVSTSQASGVLRGTSRPLRDAVHRLGQGTPCWESRQPEPLVFAVETVHPDGTRTSRLQWE
jgi:hypothetical protein